MGVLSPESAMSEARHVLYHSFPFRSSRCAWLVAELGVSEQIDTEKGSLHGNAENLNQYQQEVHPYRTIPALKLPSGEVLLESGAICLYLADQFASQAKANNLLPTPEEIGTYYNWLVHATATVDQILEPLYMQLTHTPEEKRNETLIKTQREKFTIFATTLNKHLEGRQWICGDHFTVADCVIGYDVWWASIIKKGELIADYPEIVAYQERLCARDAWKVAFSRAPKPSGGSL